MLTEQQPIQVKRAQIFNFKTRIYERIFSSKDGQEKVLSKRKINVIEADKGKQTRIMVTGKRIHADETKFDLPPISVDGDLSDFESRDGGSLQLHECIEGSEGDILTDKLETLQIQSKIVDNDSRRYEPCYCIG